MSKNKLDLPPIAIAAKWLKKIKFNGLEFSMGVIREKPVFNIIADIPQLGANGLSNGLTDCYMRQYFMDGRHTETEDSFTAFVWECVKKFMASHAARFFKINDIAIRCPKDEDPNALTDEFLGNYILDHMEERKRIRGLLIISLE